MRLAFLLVLLLPTVPAVCADDIVPTIRISAYPYYHDPEIAHRVNVFEDGIIRRERSTAPVDVVTVVDAADVEWTQARSAVPQRISLTRLDELLSRLRNLQVGELQTEYSAEHTYTDPNEARSVVRDGKVFYLGGEVTRVVTHGPTYRVQITTEDLTVDTSVYAPLSALEYKDPQHPDRADILRFIEAWLSIVEVVGGIDGFDASGYCDLLD
jgi:hypothetical protein